MRPYNRWLFYEHFELVLTISELSKKLAISDLLAVLNRQFAKPMPPEELSTSLNLPPWSKYDLDSLVEDFRLMFTRLPEAADAPEISSGTGCLSPKVPSQPGGAQETGVIPQGGRPHPQVGPREKGHSPR